jgi:hypothetical protein
VEGGMMDLVYRVFSMSGSRLGASWHGAVYDASRTRVPGGRAEVRHPVVAMLGGHSNADAVAKEAEAMGARPMQSYREPDPAAAVTPPA